MRLKAVSALHSALSAFYFPLTGCAFRHMSTYPKCRVEVIFLQFIFNHQTYRVICVGSLLDAQRHAQEPNLIGGRTSVSLDNYVSRSGSIACNGLSAPLSAVIVQALQLTC